MKRTSCFRSGSAVVIATVMSFGLLVSSPPCAASALRTDGTIIKAPGRDSLRFLLDAMLIIPAVPAPLGDAFMSTTIGISYDYRLDSITALSAAVFTGYMFDSRFEDNFLRHITSSPGVYGIGVAYRRDQPFAFFSGWYAGLRYVHTGTGLYDLDKFRRLTVPDYLSITFAEIAHVSRSSELTIGFSYILARRYWPDIAMNEYGAQFMISAGLGFGL